MSAIRLRQEIKRRLGALAKATAQVKSSYARQAIVEHLDEIETRAAILANEALDDPFGAFSEWDSAADRRAYSKI